MQTALVTGGTSGIGLEIAKLLAKDGYNLIIVAQDEEKLSITKSQLEEEFKIDVTTIHKNLSLPKSPQEIFDKLQKDSIDIDVLINSAGFGSYGEFSKTEWSNEENMMGVNMTTLTHLTKLLLPSMVARKSGKVLNIASTAAFQPGPLMAVYYATKAYVFSLSVALSEELKDTGVTATVLCPGPTSSGFQNRANLQKVKLFSGNVMDPKFVAKSGYKGLMSGKKIVIPGTKNAILVQLIRLLPQDVAARIIKRAQQEEK